MDGCAILFKKSRFVLVEKHALEFNHVAMSRARSPLPPLPTHPALMARSRPRSPPAVSRQADSDTFCSPCHSLLASFHLLCEHASIPQKLRGCACRLKVFSTMGLVCLGLLVSLPRLACVAA
jgi:hypothetical protein